jgi:phosphatidylserine/phosphatidylglycerophosphate/cardiolipin synthase-like enzyme
VKFRLDDQVPMGACHHQKVVVIDDRLAFCGGGDIAVDRWDTPGHLETDARRIMPDQSITPRATSHDDGRRECGAGAGRAFPRALAGGTKDGPMDPPVDAGGDPWPDDLPAQFTNTRVSIARTTPAWRKQAGVDEILRLHLKCILEAKETIYIENQYFTSP